MYKKNDRIRHQDKHQTVGLRKEITSTVLEYLFQPHH